MMRNLRLIICLILLNMCMIVLAGTEMEKKIENNAELFNKISNLNDEERLEYLGELSKERSEIQRKLVQLLDGSNSKEKKYAAAFLLGMYRMDQSVFVLSKYITLEDDSSRRWKREPLWDIYPVVEALIRIGKPSIPEMLKNIKTSNNEKVIELSIRVIRYVEGPEIGRFILEKELVKQSDSINKTKFKEAIKIFDELVMKTSSIQSIEEPNKKKN